MDRAELQHVVIRDNEPFNNNVFAGVNVKAGSYEIGNCLIVDNTFGGGHALELRSSSGEAWVWNNTVAGNSNDYAQYLVKTASGLIFENNVDPRFDDGAWTVSEFSPARDAGNPLDAYNDPDGTRNDMGTFGGIYGSW